MNDKKKEVKRMFDAIAHRYDLLNHLLSAGVDIYWRKKSIRLTGFKKDAILLDVACGTGDFALEAERYGIKNIFGADFSFEMLKLFSKKSESKRGRIVQMVAENPPFKSNIFTNITVAFGVRNFYDIPCAFKSFHNILKIYGKATILEFCMPKNLLVRKGYAFYFKYILPIIGRIVSKDQSAYTYLPESVEDFDRNVDLVKLFYEAGFRKVQRFTLTFGLVQVVIAEK